MINHLNEFINILNSLHLSLLKAHLITPLRLRKHFYYRKFINAF